ncbi:MAG: MerR family transcriptional regulator [Candidatus Marinimicrobia bacterium]|jgi:methanogenic corrinoid protein MtbC1|nr:MerR family transcriptional regulator [Candidatus Neomarinimicrobiota bacterium]MBT6470812.1 MerR family transcriptional regulator [Candidatus Neomarinimicrobiota bacterium]MBT6936067.1 MerR family transcriptional regulator [Candidatus Neomarinimicrobiota bacterium]
MRYLNSKDVALLMGVNVSTIKRWTDANMLPCFQTQGGHRKFTLAHINIFLKNNKKKVQKVNLFELQGLADKNLIHYIEKGDYNELCPLFLNASILADNKRLITILTGLYLKGNPLHNIYDKLVFPVLHKIGYLWAADKLSVYEEHLASEAVRIALYDLGELLEYPPLVDDTAAICFTFTGDDHELPLIMVKQLLELNQIKTLNLGRNFPIKFLKRLIDQLNPKYIVISVNYIENLDQIEEELDELLTIALKHNIKIFVGGNAITQLTDTKTELFSIIDNFNDLLSKIIL